MRPRRVHRVRTARRQAEGVVETYRQSSRGLMRVFTAILPPGDPALCTAAAHAAHHLAEVEAHLPRIRQAIRSCRYPGAEKGDAAALLWGLWSQISEAQLHFRGALDSLQALGRITSRGEREGDGPAPQGGKKGARKTGKSGKAGKRSAKASGGAGKKRGGAAKKPTRRLAPGRGKGSNSGGTVREGQKSRRGSGR